MKKRPLTAPTTAQPEVGAGRRRIVELETLAAQIVQLQQRLRKLPDAAFGDPRPDLFDERRLWDKIRANGKRLLEDQQQLWQG